jgi:hypothetical protein
VNQDHTHEVSAEEPTPTQAGEIDLAACTDEELVVLVQHYLKEIGYDPRKR